MSLPNSFTTQSLGELTLQDDGQSYRPTNQNQYRFCFHPEGDSEDWPALIDARCPHLNGNWPSLLAQSPSAINQALAGHGKVDSDMKLEHITMEGRDKVILLLGLSESEGGLSLEVVLDGQDVIQSAEITR